MQKQKLFNESNLTEGICKLMEKAMKKEAILIDDMEVPINRLGKDILISIFGKVRLKIVQNFKPEIFFIIFENPMLLNALFDQIEKSFVEQGALVYWAHKLAQELRDRRIDCPGSEYELRMC